jgi:hypothetical protein
MKRISTNFAFWIALGGILSYWIVYFPIGNEAMAVISSSLALGSGLMIALTWGFSAVYAVRTGAREGEGLLALSIFVLACSIAYRGVYGTMFHWLGRPDWMLMSPLN